METDFQSAHAFMVNSFSATLTAREGRERMQGTFPSSLSPLVIHSCEAGNVRASAGLSFLNAYLQGLSPGVKGNTGAS